MASDSILSIAPRTIQGLGGVPVTREVGYHGQQRLGDAGDLSIGELWVHRE